MAVCTATFERGANGATIATTDAGSANAWDTVDTTSGTVKYDNAHAFGLLSSKIVVTGSSAAATLSWSTSLGTVTDHYGRLYLWMDSNPTTDALRLCTTNPIWISFRVGTDGKITVAPFNGGGFSLATAIALAQWVRVEWHMIESTTVGQVELKLYNNANSSTPTESQATAANLDTGASITGIEFGSGSGSTSTATFWLDNLVAGATSYPGPVDTSPQIPIVRHAIGAGRW